MQPPAMDQPDFMDDALMHGVAIGDRDALWQLVQAAHCLRDEDVPWRPQREGVLSPGVSAAYADAAVRGMFQMVCNHLTSADAAAAAGSLKLLVLVRGSAQVPDAFVQALRTAPPQTTEYLMVIRPGLFIALADRFLRLMTCAEVWPNLGDSTTCQTQWQPAALANQPTDPLRFERGMSLAMMSVLMVFYHELAHVLCGHTAYYDEYAFDKGPGVLSDAQPVAPPGATSPRVDVTCRAIEFDADRWAGLYLAKVLMTQGVFGTVTEEEIPNWCELVALVAGITFNAFESAVLTNDYRAGYHLPSTRMECFLEGFARGMGVDSHRLFANGANMAYKFCAAHYVQPGTLAEIQEDIAAVGQSTWPELVRLGSDLSAMGSQVALLRTPRRSKDD